MQVRIRIPRRRPRKLVARRRSRRSAQMALIIALVAVFGSFYALLGDSGLVAVMHMRGRAAQLRTDIAAQERVNQELLDTIKPLRDGDPDAIERLARERLNMARPGDTIYLLPPETQIEPALVDPRSPTAPPSPSRR